MEEDDDVDSIEYKDGTKTARCPDCGGRMRWCESCQAWTKTCCNEFGTCLCS